MNDGGCVKVVVWMKSEDGERISDGLISSKDCYSGLLVSVSEPVWSQ